MSSDGGVSKSPKGWEIAALGEIEARGIVKLGRGKIISKRDIASNPGDYPIYSSAGQNGGEFGRYGSFLFDEELITWSVDGGGHLFYRKKHRFSVTNVGGWLRINDFNIFGYKYLFFALTYLHSNISFDWSRKAHPSVIRLAYDRIPIPPLAEQEKIVEILEEQFSRLDAALASVRVVREKSARFRRSLLNSIFENQFRKYGDSPIEEMLEVLPSGRKLDQGWSPQCLRQSVENNEDWGVLITTAVQHGSFNWKENKLLPATMAPRPAIELKNGDFLMTRLGPRPRCGVACMVRETRSQLMVPDKMYRFRPNQLVLEANFLNIFITSPQFLDAIEVLKTGTSESGMNITQSRFLAVKVPRTPIGEQIEIASDIAAQLSRLEASLAIADAIEKKASALRRSLLHAAFSGNLTKEWREAAYV
jgi:type I restriction enzyme S subunit